MKIESRITFKAIKRDEAIGGFQRARVSSARCLDRSRGQSGLRFLIVALICSLIWSGCLIWVDNSLALIPDGDPRTNVNLEQIYGLDDGQSDHYLYDANQPHDQTGGQLFVRGNGGRDDNRPRSFHVKSLMTTVLIPPNPESTSNFNERRTVAAYTDYGHLKVPADADSTSYKYQYFQGYPYARAALFYGRPAYTDRKLGPELLCSICMALMNR